MFWAPQKSACSCVWFASQLGVWFASQLGVWFASQLGVWFASQLGIWCRPALDLDLDLDLALDPPRDQKIAAPTPRENPAKNMKNEVWLK